MCEAKPGVRCAGDTCQTATTTKAAYEKAVPGGPAVSPLDAGAAHFTAADVEQLSDRVHGALVSDEVLSGDNGDVGYFLEREEFVHNVVDYALDVPVGERADQRYYDAAAASFDDTAKDSTLLSAPEHPRWDSRYWSDSTIGVVENTVTAVLTEKQRALT